MRRQFVDFGQVLPGVKLRVDGCMEEKNGYFLHLCLSVITGCGSIDVKWRDKS